MCSGRCRNCCSNSILLYRQARAAFRIKADRRISVVILLVWLIVLGLFFIHGGGTQNNEYIKFGFGPSEDLWFLGAVIDTWGKWTQLILFSCLDTAVNVWASEVIGPWINNTIYDENQEEIEYSHAEAMAITNCFFFYHAWRNLFTLYLAFTQIDILCARILVEAGVTLGTSWSYIRPKRRRILISTTDREEAIELEHAVDVTIDEFNSSS